MGRETLTGEIALAADKALTIAAVRHLLDDSGGTYSVTDEWYETDHGMAVSPPDTNCEFEVKDDGSGPIVAVHEVDNCGEIMNVGVHVYRVDSDARWFTEAFLTETGPTPEDLGRDPYRLH